MSASQCGGGSGRSSATSVPESGAVASGSVVLCSVTGIVRVEAEVGEGRAPRAHDGPVDAGLGGGVPAGEYAVPALGHVGRRSGPQPTAHDVLAPGLRD